MKRILALLTISFLLGSAAAQETIYPAPAQKGLLFIKNGTVHVGNGTLLTNTTIKIENGKITEIGPNLAIPAGNVQVVDATGKHVYPGLILASSQLGLVEVNSVRATIDHTELGTINPSIRSIVAYNTDSKVINTLRSNGILLANIVPQGGLISGSSSVVQLDAWNWEDALYAADKHMHFSMPSLVARPNRFAQFTGTDSRQPADVVKAALSRIDEVKQFFREAKAYFANAKNEKTNLKFEAARRLFSKEQKLFIHCDLVKEMLVAIDFVKEFGFDVVIVGGSESWQIPDLLKQHN
ncbi:MAG TPA: amidohydrolase, partial [Lacibacter sp.]|nr:amidohydrolase [Lacibacter sp.]